MDDCPAAVRLDPREGSAGNPVTLMAYDGLTHRESEVLRLIAFGNTSKRIAEALQVSIHTISNHRKHICRKLRLHSTAELVAFAARNVFGEKAEAAGD